MDAPFPRFARVSVLTLRAFGVVFSLAFAVLWQCSALQAQEKPHRILLLQPYNYTNPSGTVMADALRRRLLEGSPQKVEIDAEFLDLARASDPEHEPRMAAFLRDRYARAPPDVIIAIGDALAFVTRYRATFAPAIPVVFMAVSPETYASLRPPSEVTGILYESEQHLRNTLTLAELLQPEARRLFVVAGSGRVDRRWQAVSRRIIESRARKFETTYLFELSYNALIDEISRVPPDSIVLLLTVFEDATGKFFVPIEVGRTLTKLSPAPTYAPYFSGLGMGLVGAASETYESMGAAAANVALEILAGKEPGAIAPRANPEQSYRVDSKAMERWGLSEQKLPAGTVVLFKEPTIWEQHRDFVLATIGIIALQSAFAGALLLERRSRKHAEVLLTESEARMSFTAAAANVGLWQYNPETDELWATEHCRAMFGLDPDVPFTRTSFLATIHPEDREAAFAALRHAWDSELPSSSDVRAVGAGLQVKWIRILARTHQDEPRDPKQLSGTFIDISEQKAAEVEVALQRREVAHLTRVSALGELSGAIAHEINQPLTAILANAQAALLLLPEGAPNVAEVREALQDIVHEDNRAGQVIKRLKTLLKKGEITYEPIELNEIVNTTIALLNSELIGRRVRLQVVLANNLPLTSGDPVQLQQVLINFIVNAIDAMAETPAEQRLITVSTQMTRLGSAEVVVRDRGTGIPPLEGGRVFEPFFTTKQHGLGLGLTICSTIIEAHGGELSVTNSASGGAEARFSLPAQEMLIAAQ
jgi:signal transduction histidine kinase